MDDETRQELIEQVSAFRAVDETIKTAGWQKFILPRFERIKEGHLHTLKNTTLENVTELPKIVRAQEGIKAVDMLLEDIEFCKQEGKEAIETLKKTK